MVIIGIEDPEGNISYVTVAMPSACGKTNLAMLESALPGYKVWTLGDDIAWMNVGPDGRLYAINPETGLFGVAPGTSKKTNPNMLKTLKRGTFYPTLFTNTALDIDVNEPWWEGLDGPVPHNLMDWRGNNWSPSEDGTAAHPNSRFTVSIYNCPTLSDEFDNPAGVPISAIILGGRRTRLLPLVVEAFDWQNGVFLGARAGSETTAAAAGRVGKLRRDPMAMIPFCGYNMGDYFGHWLAMEQKMTHPPKIFSVNWFRVDEEGEFIWPGFGDNIRVLKWILDRVNGRAQAKETPIGLVPRLNDLDLEGLHIPEEKMQKILEVDREDWDQELRDVKEFLNQFGDHIPEEIWADYDQLVRRIKT